MPNSSSIIIHSWPIVQIGLRSILQSLKIEVRDVYPECPECKIFTEMSDVVMLIDLRHEEFIRKHQKFLRKRNFSIIGIDFNNQQAFDTSLFDEILLQSDNQNLLFNKLNRFSNLWTKNRTTNQLSSREIEVLKLVALGQSNKQISEKLFISIHTVITHRKHITSKLGIKSISGLTLYAVINSMIE